MVVFCGFYDYESHDHDPPPSGDAHSIVLFITMLLVYSYYCLSARRQRSTMDAVSATIFGGG
jgi:hypothetical protein